MRMGGSSIYRGMADTAPRKRTASQPRSPGAGGKAAPKRLRPIVRIEIDRDALASIDKRFVAAHLGVGLAAGWLASWVVGGSRLLRYVTTGLIGSFVGGWLIDKLGIDLGIRSPLLTRIATATIGAGAVVLLARLLA